ncbi:MAG TPA: hypothetical protein VGK73_02615, partial [Polyangiaceae bacterium]
MRRAAMLGPLLFACSGAESNDGGDPLPSAGASGSSASGTGGRVANAGDGGAAAQAGSGAAAAQAGNGGLGASSGGPPKG